MANVLGVSPAWLMGFDVPMERSASPSPEPPALSACEEELIEAYRNASNDTQIAVCAVLGVKRDTESGMEGITA